MGLNVKKDVIEKQTTTFTDQGTLIELNISKAESILFTFYNVIC